MSEKLDSALNKLIKVNFQCILQEEKLKYLYMDIK